MNQDHKSEDEETGPVSEEELMGTDHPPVSQDKGGKQNPDSAASMTATQSKHAGFIRRAVGRIIDLLIVSLVTFILFFAIFGLEGVDDSLTQIKGLLSSLGKGTGLEIPAALAIFVLTIIFVTVSFPPQQRHRPTGRTNSINQDHKSEDEETGPVSEEDLLAPPPLVSQDRGVEQIPDSAASMTAVELKYAGFIRRAVARVIDALIMSLIPIVLFLAIVGWVDVGDSIAPVKQVSSLSGKGVGGFELVVGVFVLVVMIGLGLIVLTIVGLATGLIYTTLFVGTSGATPGKMAMGLEVIRPDASRVGFLCAFSRCFTELLAFVLIVVCLYLTQDFPAISVLLALVYLAGYLMVAIDRKEHRALHDRLCNTRVVRKQGVAPKNGQGAVKFPRNDGQEVEVVSGF